MVIRLLSAPLSATRPAPAMEARELSCPGLKAPSVCRLLAMTPITVEVPKPRTGPITTVYS